MWTEAVLTAELVPAERDKWVEKLEEWGDEVAEYYDRVFAVAVEAARQGWDYPPLLRVLEGEIPEQGAWEGDISWYAGELADARLNVLERQGRLDEALRLAEAEGQFTRYVAILIKLDRVEEAVEYALRAVTSADEALFLAKLLRDRENIEHALRIAEQGLTMEGPGRVALSVWLRDLAARPGHLPCDPAARR